ncbi:GNAT family N-acetyltransferase [Periweissella ghanensis]|uniref:N-acetyltransferase domain-containing protein n=1 Tax=Periweissella ghanensis TaxID=467997 RepID=A0ABM8ZFE1_9LACO|nr:GNAT family N-acetyltransferase [Periweissella ghanensis]MCM0601364.1 GNAT family N-acetyltransferase [Periweissella ghanensis]CAH0419418.1 hypothetical protein WGH24286_01876 [Periweissella ghanensis]
MQIEVRPLQPTDFEGYWPLISDPHLAREAGFWAVEDVFAGQMMFQAALARKMTYVVIYRQQIVGSIAFEADATKPLWFEIGYVLLPAYWHRGIMTTAVAQGLDLAMADLHCQGLWAKVTTTNVASANVLIKNGFQQQMNQGADGTTKYLWQP